MLVVIEYCVWSMRKGFCICSSNRSQITRPWDVSDSGLSPRNMSTNSSPPKRAMTSSARKTDSKRWEKAASNASPKACPVWLACLKWSISIKQNRAAPSKVLSSSGIRCSRKRRFGSLHSGSTKTSCSISCGLSESSLSWVASAMIWIELNRTKRRRGTSDLVLR